MGANERSQPAGRASLSFGALRSTVERILPGKETVLQVTKVSGLGPRPFSG